MPCSFALHLAFPRTGLPWIAPLAFAGLFAAWTSVPPRTAAVVGYLAGVVFFALNFSWFGETAGALLGSFGALLDVGPALVEAVAFAAAAAIASSAAQRLSGPAVALVAAAGFTVAEVLRSSGVLGAPLYQIGAAFVDTPLAPLAAFGGVYALTFAVALTGAGLGLAATAAPARRRDSLAGLGVISIAVAAAAGLAELAWPARIVGPATFRVAAVQGNIRQSVKWQADALPLAVDRYTRLTLALRSRHPQFVLWPETVITTDLLLDPVLDASPENAALAAQSRDLRVRFGALARSLDTLLAVGTDEATLAAPYNDLVFFAPSGGIEAVYRKRQLVPFAEFLPGPGWLRAAPFASLVSNFGAGTLLGPIDARLAIAPMICWEADFTDLGQRQAAAGARFFAIATDDAWFGESDGPFAQAQLAQLRAIETGRWVVRAAATGISGIIAPDGTWRERLDLGRAGVVSGTIGEPQPTFYGRFGPWPFGVVLTVAVVAAAVAGRRRA